MNLFQSIFYSINFTTARHNIHLIDSFNEIQLDSYDVNLVPYELHINDVGHIVLKKKLEEFML